jgi:ubiquitin carboxyl-terminal hydrolase 14
VDVKWGKEHYRNVELSTEESIQVFKEQLFSLTKIPLNRQKIMYKGGMLKDSWETILPNMKNVHAQNSSSLLNATHPQMMIFS